MSESLFESTHDAADLYTIGHSNLDLDLFVAQLEAVSIECLVDVRRYPGSRHWPHFHRETLSAALPERGIEYRHIEALGGRRSARPDSINTAWRNASFRGYADYMATTEFRGAFDELLLRAREARTAIMCSEALWWRCHRSLIADVAVARGERVVHLRSFKQDDHRLREFARVTEDRWVIYPSEPRKPAMAVSARQIPFQR